MFKALLENDDVNAIFVDWSKGTAFPYIQASGDTRIVGAQLSHLLELLHNETGMKYSDVHLVGFSLGAQMASYAGRNLRRKGHVVGRITGLDPASIYFDGAARDVRLDKSDAKFVDVIHTDCKSMFVKGFGGAGRMGHVDFYPNGGFHQPGCGKLNTNFKQYMACSHYRAVSYFIESIKSKCQFTAYPCKSWRQFKSGKCRRCPKSGCPVMGYHARKQHNVRGSFYLKTNSNKPYCK